MANDPDAGGIAELRRQLDEARSELTAARHRVALAEAASMRSRGFIHRTQPLLRNARMLLQSMQASRFWKARNAWFRLKHRLGLHPTGAQPLWVPPAEEPEWTIDGDAAYDQWRLDHRVGASDIRRMIDTLPLLPLQPTFSIIMPIYDPNPAFLRAAIESVCAQVYPNWELCAVDDASTDTAIRRLLEEYVVHDQRVRPVFRDENGHIAAASNSGLSVARGDFVALMDHDDLLSVDALFENALLINRRPDVDVIYSDEDKIDERGLHLQPHFKPDWSPDSLLSRNYVSHLGVYRKAVVERIGGFRTGFEGSQDYDLILRVAEITDRIAHIPRVLYHWRIHPESTAATRDQKGYAFDAAERALEEALVRRGEPGRVERGDVMPGIYTVRYDIRRPARVAIIVPTRDHGDDVERCLRSLFDRSSYGDFEVILIDNGSRDQRSIEVFRDWGTRENDRLRVVPYDVPFNFSRIVNYGVSQTSAAYVVLLNNDTEIITADWIEAMVEQAQRPVIGAVGAKLLFPDETVQHGGVVIGIGGVAGHSHKYFPRRAAGYFGTLATVGNVSAVTGACLMVRRALFEEVGGFDEALAIAFNDVDFCLRLRDAGYYNVYLPHVELYHYESKSRGQEDTPEKQARFLREQRIMHERWATDLVPDPHYNRNLTLKTEDFAYRI